MVEGLTLADQIHDLGLDGLAAERDALKAENAALRQVLTRCAEAVGIAGLELLELLPLELALALAGRA